MGMNLRYGPMDYIRKDNTYDFDGAYVANIGGRNPYGGTDYFVDGNVKDEVAVTSGDDCSWDKPYNTLSLAIKASNISIALSANRWWARRNRIFCCGDQELTEDLTIFPEKCDVIGVGYDVTHRPVLTGNHTIAAVATGKARGTRFFNLDFWGNAAGPTITLPADSPGCEWHGCTFIPRTAGATYAILLVDDNRNTVVNNCRMELNVNVPSTGIYAVGIGVTGNGQHNHRYTNNFIRATAGVSIAASSNGYNTIIGNNIIHATVLTINDDGDLAYVIDNRLITDVDTDSDTAGGIDCKEEYACGNIVTGSGTEGNADTFPFARIAA